MSSQISIEQAKIEVEKIIQELTSTLSQCRQRVQEIEVGSSDLYQNSQKKNMELIELASAQIHHTVNEYFKEVGDNYVSLQSKYPTNEGKGLIVHQIDSQLAQLNDYSTKLQTNKFVIKDYMTFESHNFYKIIEDIDKEIQNLKEQSQNVQKKSRVLQEQLPQVKVNVRVVEGLYLNLNEFASTAWSCDQKKQIYEHPVIDQNSFFQSGVMPLPVFDEEKKSFGYFSINNRQTYVHNYQSLQQGFYQSTNIVTPDGLIYQIGGVNQQGIIVNSMIYIDPQTQQTIKLAPMNVKRVAASACYVPSHDDKGYIYVFGGRSNNNIRTRLCERYNITKNQWEQIEMMSNGKARSSVAYDDINLCIYLFFGTDSNQNNINQIEKYDISKNKWFIINSTNYLPGFDVTFGSAVQINKNNILLFGGMRDSNYFHESIYFNRKILIFNTLNSTFAVSNWQLPIDFLPICNTVIQDKKIYAIGTFLKSVDEQPQLYLDGAFVLEIDQQAPKVIKYVKAFSK